MGLQEEDRDVTRTLWLKDPEKDDIPLEKNLQVYRFCRIPFGVNTCPYLLNAVNQLHMKKIGTPLAKEIAGQLYVDNLIFGADDAEDAIRKYEETKNMFYEANMNMTTWSANSEDFRKYIPPADLSAREADKVLGVTWNRTTDLMNISCPKLEDMITATTKRQILKYKSSIFDPLGIVAFMGVRPTLVMKKLWDEYPKLGWDDPLPSEIIHLWEKIAEKTAQIGDHSFPRLTFSGKPDKVDIIAFTDASKEAMCVTIYLKWNGETRLVMGKCRIAPKKVSTIPRKELLAILLGAKLVNYVRNQSEFLLVLQYSFLIHRLLWHGSNQTKF